MWCWWKKVPMEWYLYSELCKGVSVSIPPNKIHIFFSFKTVLVFHFILSDYTSHDKMNYTTFLLVPWRQTYHFHKQTTTLVRIHYHTKLTLHVTPMVLNLCFVSLITFYMPFLSTHCLPAWILSQIVINIWITAHFTVDTVIRCLVTDMQTCFTSKRVYTFDLLVLSITPNLSKIQ